MHAAVVANSRHAEHRAGGWCSPHPPADSAAPDPCPRARRRPFFNPFLPGILHRTLDTSRQPGG